MTQKVITVIKWEKKLKVLFYESDEDKKKDKEWKKEKMKQVCVIVESVFIALFLSP